ncbi:hypothetical protein B0H10DRAFT_2189870 [Mycena sp. CBHHK59/15]|nr:hypothetical protein B0H10DRAFT_2189870 [Mycena sp. CBHHK59/15]
MDVNAHAQPETHGFDALAALNVALFIPTIDRLGIVFTGTGDIVPMSRSMRRCLRLLRKFSSMSEVKISLEVATYQHNFLVKGNIKEPLRRYFQELLDAIANLPAIKTVRVATNWTFDGAYMVEIFPLTAGNHPSSSTRALPAILQRSWSLSKAIMSTKIFRRSPSAQPDDLRHGSLNTFLIDTPILVVPSFYNWTLSILASRTVTTLRVHMLLAKADWSVILPKIVDAVPRLTDMTIMGAHMDVVDLVHSIVRLRHLTTLTIDSEVGLSSESTESLPPSFRLVSDYVKDSVIAQNSVSNSVPLHLVPNQWTPDQIGDISRSHKALLTLDVRAQILPEAVMCRHMNLALARGAVWDRTFGAIQSLNLRGYSDRNPVVLARWTITIRGVQFIVTKSLASIVLGRTCFLDLPDDVLLAVFGNLRSELYSLSRLCRRLHLVALPLYLAQNGIPNPTEICDFRLINYPTPCDVLSALNSAFFLTKVKRVICQFQQGGIIACYLDNVERLTGFLAKLSSVREVSLHLVSLGNGDNDINERVHEKWRAVFGQLLNVVVERSCVSLTIRSPPYLRHQTEFSWPKEGLQLSSLARSRSALHSFSFHTFTGLSYAGARWIFSALRCSRISSLCISVTSNSVLDAIAAELPNLAELDIVYYSPAFDKLLEFLCKLTALIQLTLPIDATVPVAAGFVERSMPRFSHLRTLIAPPPLIVHFLTAERPFPVLRSLEIRTTTAHERPHEGTISRILVALRDHGLQPAVALEIILERPQNWVGFAEWWNKLGGCERLLGVEDWTETSLFVGTLKLRGTKQGPLGPSCEDVLRAIIPQFPPFFIY